MSGVGLLRGRLLVLAMAIVAVLGTGTWFALTRASAQESTGHSSTAGPGPAASASAPAVPAGPLRVVSVSPATHSTDVNGASPVKVVFSAAIAADSPRPRLSPRIRGSWNQVSATTLQFVPGRAFGPQTTVRLHIPAGPAGIKSVAGGQLARAVSVRFRTGEYSLLRLQQLLAQLGYLPLTWAPVATDAPATDASAQLAAAFSPPLGNFTWQPGYPRRLRSFWKLGGASLVLKGAVMAFESDHAMTMDGVPGPAVWSAVLKAVAKAQDNTHGYSYALASEKSPETLTVWHNGHVVARSLANTGAPVAPTTIGTAAVYLRYKFQIMKGTNPDGTKYADPVSWVSYFRAGEAVHYFGRASYGFPQSLGCVELPLAAAHQVWPYLTYGTLVTVAAP